MDGKLRNMTSVYLTAEKGIWMLYRMGSRVANNLYVGSAGGHFEKDELSDARACALRELREELSLTEADLEDLRLRYITYRLKNGEIRQNYYFFARLMGQHSLTSAEGRLEFVAYEDITALPMPVSAKHMMAHYLSVGRYDDALRAGITRQAGTEFVTLTEFPG